MKKVICLVICFSLTGCATWAPMSYQEQCAVKGMRLGGVSESNGSASAYNWQTGQTATAHSSSESLNCMVPQTPKEQCEVSNLHRSTSPKAEWNEGERGRYFLRYLGFIALIIPGVVIYQLQDNAKDSAIEESRSIASAQAPCN